MTNKPWLSQYPADVDHEIDLDQYDSLNELIAMSPVSSTTAMRLIVAIGRSA